MEKSEPTNMLVRIPPEIRAWIEAEARRDDRTFTSFIVRTLREKMQEREQAVREQAAR